jgi:hypothetical protein
MTQHGYFDPGQSYYGYADQQARQAAQEAASTLGQDIVNQRLIEAQRQGDLVAQEAAQRAAAEAAYVRDMHTRQVGYAPAVAPRPAAPPRPRELTPFERAQQLVREEAARKERQRQEVAAAEARRLGAIRAREIQQYKTVLTAIQVITFLVVTIAAIPAVVTAIFGPYSGDYPGGYAVCVVWAVALAGFIACGKLKRRL